MARGDRRAEILDAAEELFVRNGLRRTSMEAIAARAGIAKPTLYAYFADKAAVFDALAGRVAGEWRTAFLAALEGDGDVAQRIGAALVAKHKALHLLFAGSPHAAEIYGAHEEGGAPQLAALDAELAERIERELQSAGASEARLVTQVLLAASAGIARRARSAAELGPALRLLAERLLRDGPGGLR